MSPQVIALFGVIIQESASVELKVSAESEEITHTTQYGKSAKPFGALRTAIVEFLADSYQAFYKDLHASFAEVDLYNTLLHYFELHPYHNILHQKVCDIFILGLDKNLDPIVNYFLYQTSLVKKILDTSKNYGLGHGFHVFESSNNRVAKGFLIFIRKIANKLVEMQKANEEIASFLESIPEWTEYQDTELKTANEINNKRLGQDVKKKSSLFDNAKEDDPEEDPFVKNYLNMMGVKQVTQDSSDDLEEDNDEDILKHSDSYERSGRDDPDEELLDN